MIPTDHFSLIITMFFSQNFVKRNNTKPVGLKSPTLIL